MGQDRNVLNTFTNHIFDEILGMYHAQARFYDPSNRRFISPDPHWGAHNRIFGDRRVIVPSNEAIRQSGNLYAYALNNPLRFTDPTGLFAVGGSHAPVQTRQSTTHIDAGETRINPGVIMTIRNPGYTPAFDPANNPNKNWSPDTPNTFMQDYFSSSGNMFGAFHGGADLAFSIYSELALRNLRAGMPLNAQSYMVNDLTWARYINHRGQINATRTSHARTAGWLRYAAYIPVIIDVVDGVVINIVSDTPERIPVDIVVDIGITGGTIVLSGAAAKVTVWTIGKTGAFAGGAAGSKVPLVGTAIGAVVGFGVGVFIYWQTDVREFSDGNTLREEVKDICNSVFGN